MVALCRSAGVPIVARGGNTGLVGGSVANADQVLIDLRRLDAIGTVRDGIVTAGAGATIGALQRHASSVGWRYPVDFGSRDMATVGGSIATNAGGVHVFRHGMTRSQVLGVEMVDGHGRLINGQRSVVKDNAGPNLGALMCGSEGTLGIITGATLRLIPAAPDRTVALLAFDSLADALTATGTLRVVPEVEAIELIDSPSWALMTEELGDTFGTTARDRPGAVLAIETAVDADTTLAALHDVGTVADSAVGTGGMADRLWRYRDGIADVLARRGPVTKFDVSVPTDRLAELMDGTRRRAATDSPAAEMFAFGHAVDGNLHINLLGVTEQAALADAVYGLVLDLGGSVSAEHGIGRTKNEWLSRQRSAGELAAFECLRDAFDPQRLFNPGVLEPMGRT